jgi:hypothetical protein
MLMLKEDSHPHHQKRYRVFLAWTLPIVLLPLVGCCIWGWWYLVLTPTFPLPKAATLHAHKDTSTSATLGYVEVYRIAVAPRDVAAFYERAGATCTPTNSTLDCAGFTFLQRGYYVVRIDTSLSVQAPAVTTFLLQASWVAP